MVKSKIRLPAVCGQFYPSSLKQLKNQIESFTDWKKTKSDVIGCMLPHAGYMYSGHIAAEVVSGINVKDNVIVLGPNHTGYGPIFSIMTEGVWQTLLGDIEINTSLGCAIRDKSKYLKEDSLAHMYEHSIEVELPILQYTKGNFKIVPIVIGPEELKSYKDIGREIAEVLETLKLKDSTLIVASSDLTHYEPQESAKKKDALAIQAILELDEDKLWHVLRKFDISMCGYAPAIIMLSCAKVLGAKDARLVKYQTSGDTTGDYSAVVGYAGIIIY